MGTDVWKHQSELVIPADGRPLGTRVLAGLAAMAEGALAAFTGDLDAPLAVVSRLRGTGRGVSSSRLFAEMERQHPVTLTYPFEGSDRVGGAVWIVGQILGNGSTTSIAKLRWDSRALDLPMHVHDHSDRFILVAQGRGYFHVTDEPAEAFTGTRIRSIPARERDVFLFRRGTVHTFSTDQEPMTLLSCQLPYLPFDDPRQYRLPAARWTAQQHPQDRYTPGIACDPGWMVVARREPSQDPASILTIARAMNGNPVG